MAFLDDIKSKHLTTFVLVTIGDDICISTQKITFDDKYYKPILLNVPSISESLDIEQRKYKISSVSLSISDYEEDGERFSDTLNTLMNKEVNIYYSSPSCSDLNDCYKVGNYIVRSFSQDEDKVTLNCEDISQDKLQTEVPLQDMGDNESILEKYRNKPIPMVFGEVDRSPCVLDSKKIIFDVGDATNLSGITIDNIFIKMKTPLYVYDDDSTYSNVLHDISEILTQEEFPYIQEQQYTDVSNLGYLELKNTKLLRKDGIQVRRFAKSASPNLYNDNQAENIVDATDIIDRDGNPQDTIDNDTSSYVLVQDAQFHTSDEVGGIDGDFNPITLSFFRYYRMIIPIVKAKDTIANGIPEIAINNKRFPIPFNGLSDEGSNFINNADNENYIIAGGSNAGSLNNVPFFPNNLESHPSSLENYSDLIIFNETEVGTESGQGEASLDQFNVDIGFKDTSFQESSAAIGCFANEQLFELVFFAKLPQIALLPSGETYTSELVARIREIDTTFIADIKEPLKKNYFVHAIGRAGSNSSSQSIYSEILSELDFDQELIQEQLNNIELGQYAFTVDKKTNSKKLIEELSQSTPLYPYFKDGEFRIKSIKTDYDGTNNIIKSEDVIKYKYDRTKIEKVYSKVNIKYHYDYGLKDFTKETGFVSANQLVSIDGYLIGDNEDYFGQDFAQEFIFESKYIRDEPTALNLAKYLVGLHANQHNIINLTLPLNYLTLELGDIVKFDSLIQGRKIFGEDYTLNQSRNGQNIYPYFFVEQIKKSLDKVEVKLYQLHNFSFDDSIVYGCTNQNAENYDPSATTLDDSCIFPELEEGCTNQDSLNYNPNAVLDNGTCVNQLQLLPPEIITPTDGQVFSNEFVAEELGNNLIPSPADNSTFDTTFDIATDAFLETTATEGSGLGYITVFYDGLEIQTAEDWYNVVVHNISTFQFSRAIIEADGDIIDGWNLRVEDMTFSVGDNVRFMKTAYTDSTWYLTDYTEDTLDEFGSFTRLSFLNGSLGLYQSYSMANYGLSLDINETLSEGSTYRLSFKHKTLEGAPANLFVSLGGVTSESITPNVSEEWAEASVDLTMPSDSINPTINVYIEQSYSTTYSDLFIDDIYLNEVLNEGGVDIPQAIVEWNPSPNLIGEISQLGLTTTGAYYYKIEDLDGNYSHNLFPIPASNSINSIVIDFDQVNIPQNVLLKLTIGCYSEQTYQGNSVFTSDNIINGLPVAEDYTFFSWGEVDEIIDGDIVLGDVNMDGAVNVADIVLMVGHILTLGGSDLTAEQIMAGDLTGDGDIDVADIVAVVGVILGDSNGGGKPDTGSDQ